MFDLEKEIAAWRQEMFCAGVQQPEVLDELESHLRNDIASLVSSGKSEMAAFKLAVSQLGAADSLSAEFTKKNHSRPPIKFAVVLGIVAFLADFFFSTYFGKSAGGFDWLLFAHVFTFSAGYVAALLGGFFAMAAVIYRRYGSFSLGRDASLIRVVKRSSFIAAALVAVGFSLGWQWTRQRHGLILFDVRNPRFIGAQCATIWIIGLAVWQLFNSPSHRSMILLGIFGNMVVGLAWWTPVILYHRDRLSPPGDGFGTYWLPLAIIVITGIIFLALGVSPKESKPAVKS